MIIILHPDTDKNGQPYHALLDHLTKLPGIQHRVHEEVGTQQTLTEIYLIGDTASIDGSQIESFASVERVVRISHQYRILGRHKDDSRPSHFTYNGVTFGQDNFYLFAGLCAVDTRDHVENMMRSLRDHGQICTRMGAYKSAHDHLTKLPGIQHRVHEEVGTQQTLTEIYLIGDTASIDGSQIESFASVERVVRISHQYRILGRHKDDSRPSHFTYNGVTFGQDNFYLFAGLCAVDTRDHVENMMRSLRDHGQICTRMGAYKPRTNPYSFQGHGKSCLPYVFELAGKYDIKVIAMEVTHEDHIDEIHEVLERSGNPTGVMLQIGTRNAQNFELLKNVGRQKTYPVLLKRGFGITLEESLNAAEYLASEGNRKVVFCLRGMKTNLGDPHRNVVDFAHVPVVKRLTRMPVCVDPSHSVGYPIAMEVTHEDHIDEIHEVLERSGNPTGVMLQIGTRNAQNFELLKNVGRQKTYPVLLKRGFGITLEESLNAAEYLASEGNRKVVFCLRGMKTNLGDPHRNVVDFAHVPVVKRLTRMPVCVDPSHSVGCRSASPDGMMDVMHASVQGVIAGANMVLVDFHPEPTKALVDGPQALLIEELPWFLEDVQIAREAYEKRLKLVQRVNPPDALREVG